MHPLSAARFFHGFGPLGDACPRAAAQRFPAVGVSGAMIGLTLGRYLSSRFLRMILAVFATIFSLVYVIDFVELLRRTGNIAGVTASSVAYLSFLRTPAVSEQVLPFCVLFGSMAVFLNLTRKLELLVARAAGVSVWQFLGPPIFIAVVIGVASVCLLNPLSAAMKQQADRIELSIFGKDGSADAKTGLWVRQKSVDGESIMQAETASQGNNVLRGVTRLCLRPRGALRAAPRRQPGHPGERGVAARRRQGVGAGRRGADLFDLSARHQPAAGPGFGEFDVGRGRSILGAAVPAGGNRIGRARRQRLSPAVSDAPRPSPAAPSP